MKIKKIMRNAVDFLKFKKIDIYKENKINPYSGEIRKISVIIPNYNYAQYIVQRIDSVLYQTYPIYELIILDDCSSDESVQIIENKIKKIKHVNIKFIKNQKNSGNVFAQWQKGFESATGDYIWIAEADDISSPYFLERVIQPFIEDEEVKISYTDSKVINQNNIIKMNTVRRWVDTYAPKRWDNSYINDGKKEIENYLAVKNTIVNVSSCVFKKGEYTEILEKCKEFKLAGDWYFYINVLDKGKISYLNQALNYYRIHNKRVTSNTPKQEELEEIKKIHEFIEKNYTIDDKIKTKMELYEENFLSK